MKLSSNSGGFNLKKDVIMSLERKEATSERNGFVQLNFEEIELVNGQGLITLTGSFL